MGATKIINVLKDDKFEELLAIVKDTDASEVIFVLPKKTRAFRSEEQFAALEKEISGSNKSVAFLCSNPEVNEFAKKYKFDVLSTKIESQRSKTSPFGMARQAKPIAVTAIAEESDTDDLEDELGEHHPPFGKEPEEPFDDAQGKPEEVIEEAPTDEEYKEEETEEETVEEDAPYGTELDESGNPIYDEEEKNIGEEIVSKKLTSDFEILTASAKTRGMGDIVKPSTGNNIKITQRSKRPIKIETRPEETDIQSVWGHEPVNNIWADIYKQRQPMKGFGFNFSSRGFSKKRGIGVLTATAVLILAFIIFLTTGSAKIEIRPRSQKLNTQLKVTMSPNFSLVDNSFNRIPGQLFTVSKSASGEFNATAEKDAVQKSRGTITIYNEYSTSPQPLVATTRFEYIQSGKAASEGGEPRQGRESGLVFRTLQSITVPGMKVENGIVTPGKTSVEVIADKAGQDYNVSAGNFGIMAWREKSDLARYEKIYGKSSESMHGGILGKAKIVSEFDYNNAKNQLTEKVKNDVNETLRTQSAGLELLDGIGLKIDSTKSTAEADDATNEFTMTVNGSITTVGFKKEDLLSLISNHVDKTNNLTVVPEKLELSYEDMVMNSANDLLEVTVVIGGNAYAKIDKKDIAANLMGKKEFQIKDYLGSIQNIDSAKIILSPFWVKKIPKNQEKIDILLTF